jgi:hypothetical protein
MVVESHSRKLPVASAFKYLDHQFRRGKKALMAAEGANFKYLWLCVVKYDKY